MKVRLTIVDAIGYGDRLNCSDNSKIISNYIDQQFERYLTDESGLNRRNISDNRVHCLLYFISPFSRGFAKMNSHRIMTFLLFSIFSLKPLDIECMKALHNKVNIIPIIAKSDTISKSELQRFKQNILNELNSAGVKFYRFPVDDETLAEANLKANVNSFVLKKKSEIRQK